MAGVDFYSLGDFPGIAKALGLPVSHGFLVQTVDPGGPAASAGIRGGNRVKMVTLPVGGPAQFLTGGDMIVAIDGKPVLGGTHTTRSSTATDRATIVKVKFYRGHRLLTVKARLTAYPYTPAAG